jgi:alpha-glucosidase (family GH31 glycosyl hydrolase)
MDQKPVTRRDAMKGIAVSAAALTASLTMVPPDRAEAQESPITVAGKPVEVALFAASPHTIRVTVQPIENGSPQPVPQDGAVTKTNWDTPLARVRTLSGPSTVKSGNLQAKLSANPLTVRVETAAGHLVQELKVDDASGNLSFSLGTGPLLGLGQGGPQFDRRGGTDQMRSGQAGYHLSTHGARVPIQLLVGTSGWGCFVHQPLGAFELSGQEGKLVPPHAAQSLPIDVFVMHFEDPVELPFEYAMITGFAEMPPLWSLGYQQSHRTLSTPEDIINEAKLFREKKLPCDAMIYLGTGFCPEGWNTDNGEFTWNPKPFPDPPAALKQLHDENLKVVLHAVIEGHRLTGTVTDPCTAPPLPSGRTPDGHWPPDRQVSCYWPVHKPLIEMGVDGWWPDQGDDFDAESRLARNRMYFEGQQMYRPNQRVYALHRNAYAGMQRYATFLWSGDVESRWETLRVHVPNAINTSLSGMPYWGTDIGGFIPTEEYTGELWVRWFQFAAFNPLFRSHGRDWHLHLPWGWDLGTIGFPETRGYNPDPKELHNPAIEPICKKYLELRYQLMPYLYSAVKETCETGLPIIRAMWLHYPQDPTAVARGDQYLYGRDILVAPVVEKGATSRSIYLPHGSWFDFWAGTRQEGGREITRDIDLATIPLYVRAGAVLPMDPVRQYTAEKVAGPMTLRIYPGADGKSTLYVDDGETFDYRKGKSTHVEIEWSDSQRQLHLRLRDGSELLPQAKKHIQARVVGEAAHKDFIFDGRPISIKL